MSLPDIPSRAPASYLEALAKVVFAADTPWAEIAPRWAGLREALLGFDPVRLAAIGLDGLQTLFDDPRLRDDPDKVTAVVANAEVMMALAREHGSFGNYLHLHDSTQELIADLTRDFHHVNHADAMTYLRLLTRGDDEYQVDLLMAS